MTKTDGVRQETIHLQDLLRERLLSQAEKCADKVLALFPQDETSTITPVQHAHIRWEMLLVGFTHDEINGIISKLRSREAQKMSLPCSKEDWLYLVGEEYLGRISENTAMFTLYLLKRSYERRLAGETISPHERLVVSIGKRINALLAQSPDNKDAIIADLAQTCQISNEMVWRVSTGGPRVTEQILAKLNRATLEMENSLLRLEEESSV